MSVTGCTYDGRRDEILVAYLYDDLDPGDRGAFRSHLDGCAACRTDLAALQVVRGTLARWTPPAPGVRALAPPRPPRPARLWPALAALPTWAQGAAAILVLGIAVGAANLHVEYGRGGFSLRTGWLASADAGSTQTIAAVPGIGATASSAVDMAPWHADLEALERSLRVEVQNAVGATARAVPSGGGDAELLRRVRALIESSERNQRRELALRVAEIARDVQAQRVADLQRIQRTLNIIENTTGDAIVRQGKLLNNIAVKVSQQQ